VSRQIVIAHWLIPAEPAHRFFQDLINDLARRYDAPVFEPHVTIYVGANSTDALETALSKAAQDCSQSCSKRSRSAIPMNLSKHSLSNSEPNTKLLQLNQVIRSAAQGSSDYDLKPHLSLLYKRMSAQTRRQLARSIEVPFSQVVFDSLKAVRCVSPTQSRADVEVWRVVGEKVCVPS
jgi:Cyclic phosphodiesterase-like protein.